MAVMSDDDMMEVMNSKGGTFIPTFMARNKEEAQEKFPTLLGLSKKFRVRSMKKHRRAKAKCRNYIMGEEN